MQSTNQNVHIPVFSQVSGQMRQRIGYCTLAAASYYYLTYPQCKNDTRYLHQQDPYNSESYVCYNCYNANIKHKK